MNYDDDTYRSKLREYREQEQRERDTAALPMDLAELREITRKVQFIIDQGKLDRLRQVFQERIASQGGHHDGVRYWPIANSPAAAAENELRHNLRDDRFQYHPLVTTLVELLNVPREQAIAAVVEIEVVGFRRTMLDLIDEAHHKLSKQQRRAS
jgi:hypothetical protein